MLKLVHEPLSDTDSVLLERLRRELSAMQAVSSPHVVSILRGPSVVAIRGEDHVFYEEPYYSGGTLARRLEGGALTLDAVLILARGLLDAIEALWSTARLVHRDIKPSNIVYDDSHVPVLLDLGIALHLTRTPLTDALAPSPRTPVYAAPEQFYPRRAVALDFRTDLFLTGITLYEALTGSHPYFSDGLNESEYLRRLMEGRPDPAALEAAGAPVALQRFILRMLAANPNQRYRKVDLARNALEGVAL